MYKHIAESNPRAAYALCQKYNYNVLDVKTPAHLGICLQQLVAAEGESALIDVVKIHPDRGVILEVEGQTKNFDGNSNFFNASGARPCNCGCKNCNGEEKKYLNFSGPEENGKSKSDNTATVFMAAMFMTVAVLALKK
jgi:hypothetical protein